MTRKEEMLRKPFTIIISVTESMLVKNVLIVDFAMEIT